MLRRKHCSVGHAIKTSPPWGFQKLDYIEKHGGEYIDTKYGGICTTKTVMCLVDQGTSVPIGNWGWGSKDSQYNNRGSVWTIQKETDGVIKLYLYACWRQIPTEGIQFEEPIEVTHWHGENLEVPKSPLGTRIKDKTNVTWTTDAIDESRNYTLFSRGTPYNKERLWTFKMSKNNIALRDMLPFLDETGTPCMFDKVTRKKFYNAGTGEFSYFPLIPKNYITVEYLESTGTQWIDTKQILKSNNFHFAIDYALLGGNKQNERLLQGTNFSWVCSLLFNGYGWISMPKKDSGRVGGEFDLKHYQGERIFLEFKPEEVIKNGTPLDFYGSMPLNYLTHYDSLQDTDVSLKLCSFGDPAQYTNERFAGKIFNLKLNIENNKTNFVPCLDSTGTPCLFDTVSQKPFYNSGTGDFLYPSPTSAATYSMRRPQAEYAKMTDTGVRRLYHVPADYDGSIEDYANEHGFKLLNETESPNEEGKYYAFRWVETDTELTTEWYETEPPTDELGNPIEINDEPQASTFNLRRPTPIDETVYTNTAKWAMLTDTGIRRLYKTPKDYEGSLEDYAIQCGYKQLIETECPDEEGKYYSFRWVETDDTLMTEWFEVDPPREEIFEENLDIPTE